MAQVQKVVKEALKITDSDEPMQGFCDETEIVLNETKDAIQRVINEKIDFELKPQNQQIRKLQHELIDQYNLRSESIGENENRRIKILHNDIK